MEKLDVVPLLPFLPTYREELPRDFFAKDRWPECFPANHVQDQGQCGSCWAFSVLGAIQDRLCIHGDTHDYKQLSVQDLLSCHEPKGCDGGSRDRGYQYIKKF